MNFKKAVKASKGPVKIVIGILLEFYAVLAFFSLTAASIYASMAKKIEVKQSGEVLELVLLFVMICGLLLIHYGWKDVGASKVSHFIGLHFVTQLILWGLFFAIYGRLFRFG